MTHDPITNKRNYIIHIDENDRGEIASFVEGMMPDYPNSRMVLAIVARNIRRGWLLTETEKLANLHAALHAPDPDNYEVPFP